MPLEIELVIIGSFQGVRCSTRKEESKEEIKIVATNSPLIINGFLGCGIEGQGLFILWHFQFRGQQAAHFRCQFSPFARQFFLQLCINKLFMIRHCFVKWIIKEGN